MRWIGKVSPELVPLYYQLADVTVDPIRDDDAARGRSPLKLFESWASGVPFVSADVGDRRRLLGDPPAGLLANSTDPDSLASEILTVLTHADLANSLSLRGKQRIEDYYWDRLSKQLNDLYFTFCPEPRHS
jgi:glycosyltransferase involved in cell wall biosynthesis